MGIEKRKRKDDERANAPRGKAGGGDDVVNRTAVPADEEVEEFFAIVKRIQVAVKYFQERNGGRCSDSELNARAPPRRILEFEREDFEGVQKISKNLAGKKGAGLDLNSDPACNASNDET